MNKEDIVRMAIDAGWDAHHAEFDTRIQTFAALVASAEREACAKLLEEAAQAAKDADPHGFVWIAIKTSAEGIRARGDKHD
jgi:hypothetical protein